MFKLISYCAFQSKTNLKLACKYLTGSGVTILNQFDD